MQRHTIIHQWAWTPNHKTFETVMVITGMSITRLTITVVMMTIVKMMMKTTRDTKNGS